MAIMKLPQVSTIIGILDVMDDSLIHILGSKSMSSIQYLHRTAKRSMKNTLEKQVVKYALVGKLD